MGALEDDCGTTLVTASYDQSVRVWDVAKGAQTSGFTHNEGQVNSMCLTSNARQLVLGTWQRVRVYDITSTSKDPLASFDSLFKNVTTVGFEAHGRWLYAGGDDMFCRVFELRSNQLICQRLFDRSQSTITSMEISKNQVELFVANSTGEVFKWDLRRESSEMLRVPQLKTMEYVQRLSVHPSGQRLAGITNRGRLLTWNLKTAEPWRQPMEAFDRIPSDGLSIEDDIPDVQKGYGLACRYSPNGTYLATCGSDPEGGLLQADDFTRRTPLNMACEWNWDCVFSADSRHLFTGGNDCRVNIWKTATGEKVTELGGHVKALSAICVNMPPG